MDNKSVKPLPDLWAEFRIAYSTTDEPYTCSLEARAASGGLGHRVVEDQGNQKCCNGLAAERGCYFV